MPAHCPECSHEWPDGLFGRLTCPQCRTEVKLTRLKCQECQKRLRCNGVCGLPKDGPAVVQAIESMAQATPKDKSRNVSSLASQWTITTEAGVLTICGVCGGLASDHRSRQKLGIKILFGFIRTTKCKWCKQKLETDYEQSTAYECEASPDGICKRWWIVRKAKVPTCRLCMREPQDEYQVDATDLDKMPDGRLVICHAVLNQYRVAMEVTKSSWFHPNLSPKTSTRTSTKGINP